ncbi:predicted protein [Botrytis cinerea T4]|uniref:Uncharacterized protein n=1 Tax=Botryotinia fuckeliana (strain T4) TaxID=999810 RepID=G2YY94_BOTF4|nr:predicted protein [Botrytis cinerea T4]
MEYCVESQQYNQGKCASWCSAPFNTSALHGLGTYMSISKSNKAQASSRVANMVFEPSLNWPFVRSLS